MIGTVQHRTVTVHLLDSIDQDYMEIEDCFGSTGVVVNLGTVPYCFEQ